MERAVLIVTAALALFGCERRDGKIIIDERKAEQKADEAAQKTGEAAKQLGREMKQGADQLRDRAKEKADEHRNDPAAKGGGPKVERCDGGVAPCKRDHIGQ